MNNELWKVSFAIFGKTVFCLLLSIIMVMSLSFIFSTIATENVGYDAYITDENGKNVKVYSYYHDSGEDTEKAKYEEQGKEIITVNIRSKFKGAPYAAMLVLSQICTLGTLILFINGKIYYIGDSDANKVQFGRIQYDRFKGFKLGLVSAIFYAVLYFCLLLGKIGLLGDGSLLAFRFGNYHIYSFVQILFGSESSVAKISIIAVILAALSIVIVPLICQFCYVMGYKRINLFEKLVFKGKKG